MQTGPQQCYFYLIVECILLMPPSPFDAIAIYCNCCCFGKGGDHEAFFWNRAHTPFPKFAAWVFDPRCSKHSVSPRVRRTSVMIVV